MPPGRSRADWYPTSVNEDDLAGLLDIDSLARFLREQVPGPDVPLEVERLRAGYSNETFYITRGQQRWVLRRPPRGDLLPTSHDVLREHRMLSALGGTAARVPATVVACDDSAVIGAPFYLMERVDGAVIREESPPQFESLAERRRIGEQLIDALVELHTVDWHRAGLDRFSRPEGFLQRQVARWSQQLALSLPHTRPLPGIAEVTDWLGRHLPESGPPAVVHGDYKLDNVVLAPEPPARIVALLDWEMSTVGDPLTDLAWCLAYWGPTGDPPDHMWVGTNVVTMRPGYHTRTELIARYEQGSGRRVHDFQFYLCLAVWRQAIICEGLYRLYLEGTAPNPRTADMEWVVPQTVERLHRIIAGEL
jgi:aminoglycoside phosphotransferase (APT) family kinase protein